jgi:hypothetical protein
VLLRAAALLGRACIDLAQAFAVAGERLSDSALFPGLCASRTCKADDLSRTFALAGAELLRLSEGMDTLEALLVEDWGRVVARVIASLRAELPRMCKTDACRELCAKGKGPCGVVEKIARHAGLFSSLAFELDSERIAAALDAAASPVGGWRRKNVPGSFTVSLGSLPGLAVVGGELRFGPYGAMTETGKKPYIVAPTLTMPVGIDFARGYGSYNLGVFVSVIDPAAYLQYDATQNGRLPGAQLLTLLAPGAWARAGVLDSPFTIGLYGVFRPGLRAWESGLSAPGAHALQVGLSASIDVTLYDLFTGAAKTDD